jgi:hypothetical protein
MNKIEEAVVSYNHDETRVLDAICINDKTLAKTLQSIKTERGDEMVAEVHRFLKDALEKLTLHDLLLAYVQSKRNDPLAIRLIDEEVTFLFILGSIFLQVTKDMVLTKHLAQRIMAEKNTGENCLTKTIENFVKSYGEDSKEDPIPEAVLTIVFTALIGETMDMMKNPMFLIMMMLDK